MQPDATPLNAPPHMTMPYYAEAPQPLRSVIRGIGVLAIVLGFVSLTFLIIQSIYEDYSNKSSRRGIEGFALFNQFLGRGLTVILSISLIIAGISCLQRRPRGRRVLLF